MVDPIAPLSVNESVVTYASPGNRVRLFIDNSNMDLTMRGKCREQGTSWGGFDWQKLPQWLVDQAAAVCGLDWASYEGAHVYVSHDPRDSGFDGLRGWVRWLDLQPGIQVVLKELRRKDPPTCRFCRKLITPCPHCGEEHRPRVEKGVDTAMVTDMIRLAWQNAYDIAVLVTSDSDFVPVVELLDQRGLKVVQAGFPPTGAHLRSSCWASFDMSAHRRAFERV